MEMKSAVRACPPWGLSTLAQDSPRMRALVAFLGENRGCEGAAAAADRGDAAP